MNKKELLLACLMEELAEMQQEVSKCLRFTPDHQYDGYDHSNKVRFQLEYADVCAIASMLREEGFETFIETPVNPGKEFVERYFDKMRRTEDSLKISHTLGALRDDPCHYRR